jgi:hypothetical protein
VSLKKTNIPLLPGQPARSDIHAIHCKVGSNDRYHFSECVLHSLFVDELMGTQATSFVSDDPLCRAYWEPVPLNADSAAHFIRAVRPTDVAVAISSKSHTPLAVRDAIFSALRTA